MRKLYLSNSLLIVMLLLSSMGNVTASNDTETHLNEAPKAAQRVLSTPDLKVHLSTATGKTIAFRTQEEESAVRASSGDDEIPHLVLNRNGVPTPGFERTLLVSVGKVSVPPSGVYVQLVIETQHGDPDFERENNIRIRVWKEIRYIPFDALTQQGVSIAFKVTFEPLTRLPHKTTRTPTDYFRYQITISDPQGNRLQAYGEDYAFLMENQWRVPLPNVLEATPGAAPDELLVYYYDMMPFQSDLRNPDTRIPREQVGRYIQTELIPAMSEAFQVQSNVWGFPWYKEWRNFRREEDPKTLSVALGEYQIWFHGKPASLGHSMISIRVDGTVGEYDSLTEGLMSTFHHELFHNIQRNLSLHFGGQAAIAGKDEAWMMFTEGTAVLASSVGQPAVQFEPAAQSRSYLKRANAFLGIEGVIGGGLNKSYKDIPYHTAPYWRFLYEHCGGINTEGEDPGTGMQVIRRALEALYRGQVVDINSSTDVAGALPRIMDFALQSTPSCPFQSYQESLIHFARAIYELRLTEGRCTDSVQLPRCGFLDPHRLYQIPPADRYLVGPDKATEIKGAIPSSYGIDLIELALSPSVEGKSLKLILTSNAAARVEYHVELWRTKTTNDNGEIAIRSAQANEPFSISTKNGSLIVEIENLKEDDFDELGLIITRTDPYEDIEARGAYSIELVAE